MRYNAIILDTETAQKDGNACEIATLTCGIDNGQFIEGGLSCERFNPCQLMHFGALAVHHIPPSVLRECRPHTEYELPNGVQYVIGHNVDFDAAVLQRAGVDLSNTRLICTLALSRMIYPQLDSHSLGALTYFISDNFDHARNELKNAHSAAADVMLTASLLRYMLKDRSDVADIADLWRLSEQARVPTRIAFGKHKGMAIADLPSDYRQWLLKQNDLDPYMRKALTA